MKKILLPIIFILFSIASFAQDTLTVLQYNLLYYGVTTSWCDNTNNDISDKDDYLRTIIHYIKPDIFTVNEMSSSPSIHLHMLDQVLNSNGVNHYKKANFISETGSNIANMLYFNSEKLALHSHFIAQNYIRDIDVYKLYHLSEQLSSGDTTFLICVVAHLKSSSGETNVNKRKAMAENTMEFLENYAANSNCLMMGDFNVYTSNEPAYQEFTNNSNLEIRFYDPIDTPGNWNNNSDFTSIHTQSTHADENGCASYGGMDDRFDFILISDNIKQGNKKIKYLAGTYHAVGQDGKHFNKSVNGDPLNTSVPADVLNALYHNSDHLPVTLKLLAEEKVGIEQLLSDFEIKTVNPVHNNLIIQINSKQNTDLRIELCDLTGRIRLKRQISNSANRKNLIIPVNYLESGFYILEFYSGNERLLSRKIIKN